MTFTFGAKAAKRLKAGVWLCAVCFCLRATGVEHFEALEAGGHTFSNVTITAKTPTHVFFEHSAGLASIKLDEFSDATLVQLGYAVKKKPAKRDAGSLLRDAKAKLSGIKLFNLKIPPELEPKFTETDESVIVEVKDRSYTLDKHLLKGILACLVLAYVLFCNAATEICRKCGVKPGIWCWFPIIQWGFLLRAAGMSAKWIVLMLVPIATIPILIVWSVKICRARGRGILAMFFLLLPPTSLLAFLSLALGSNPNEDLVAPDKINLGYRDARDAA